MGDFHSFSVDVAKEVGVNAAIILGAIKWWCAKNKANDKHFYDGRYWTYNSIKAWQELYPYLGKSAIEGALKKLESNGLIVVGNYNKNPYDRTKWYAITEDGLRIFGESISENQKWKTENQEPIPVSNQLHTSVNPTYMGGGEKRAMKPPTLEEVRAYVEEKGYHFDPDELYDYYDASNWHLQGGKKITSWKQCCATWERNATKYGDKKVVKRVKKTVKSEPKVGSKRYDSTTNITEVYKGNGVWEKQQPTLFEGERYEDIPYDL